jgi:hypothetical protein
LGWVVTDVHPERTLDPPPQAPDADLQRLLGQLARGIKPLPPDGGEPGKYWKDWARDLARWAARSLGVALAACVLLLYLAKLWRRASPLLAPADGFPRLAYRAELDRLSELGLSRRRGETREAFAARVQGRVPSLTVLTAVHVGVRFGSEQAKRKPKSDLEAIVRQLREEQRSAFKPWRRILGALSPWHWLKAR